MIRGDGEEAISELLSFLGRGAPALDSIGGILYKQNGQFVRVANRKRNREYGSFPRAARDTWGGGNRPRPGAALVYFSRGCNHACDFCSVVTQPGANQRAWAARSIEDVVHEVGELRSRYGICDFTIVDPNCRICS